MENKIAIQVQDLHKNHGEFTAVRGVSFEVCEGEIFSLLGPNGAGKSTTISMLSCLLQPTKGDAFVEGHSIQKDPDGVKSALGVVPQDIALYPDLSARENLEFWGKMYSLRGPALKARVDEVLEIIGLAASVLLFGVQWGQPTTVFLASIALIVAASGFGVLVMSFVKNSRQTGPVLGGVMTVGIPNLSASVDKITLVTPQGWALQSWKLALWSARLGLLIGALARREEMVNPSQFFTI